MKRATEANVYKIYLCYNGNKRLVAGESTYESKKEWRLEMSLLPYDILDEDDFNVWFDYGDI